MKRKFVLCILAALVAAMCAPAAWAQMTSVRGYVHDVEGKPIAGAKIELLNKGNGRKFEVKTDKHGEYFTMGVTSGSYDLSAFKDGKLLYMVQGIPIQWKEEGNVYNIDLKKEQEAQKAQLTPEQKKQIEEHEKQVAKIKSLNDMLAQAKAAEDAGNLVEAVKVMTQAAETDPSRNLLWARLADYELAMGKKAKSPEERKAGFTKAVEHYRKAIAIKPEGAYYNNLGDALARSGDTQGAIQAYEEAVKMDPGGAGVYYFNEGATLTNTGKVEEANQAFDKSIQADPNRAEAYYQKAMNLMSKATLKGNKMEAPPGTEETLKKYLELQPNGEHAEVAKQMLAQMGTTVETSFGKVKTKKRK
jgi:tetratricopeptide (TPR) repeat protein